ncbi:oligoribonuclease [Shewanella xiamenensis]|uniref:oligoribonuclease n=1 Tax=Shewanella xiamenensis TaxID=332186 RepID=UPI00313EFBCC
MELSKLLALLGYMTEQQALAEGFTNHGSYYGIPVWIGDVEGDFMVATKWAPLELLMSLFHIIEGVMRPILFPNEPNSFQFQLGHKIKGSIGKPYFLFGDIETGGLNGRLDNGKLGVEFYPVFELAFIVTDTDLNQVGEAIRIVVHQDEEAISRSHPWAIDTHTKSGLLDEVRQSTCSLPEAEQRIINHLKQMGIEAYNRKTKKVVIFAGNSIMFDRSYILCQLPLLHEFMHYRQLDISALALAARAWAPEVEKEAVSAKQYKHEALADIRESIAELKCYRQVLFGGNDNV